jgi:hypothetical protein
MNRLSTREDRRARAGRAWRKTGQPGERPGGTAGAMFCAGYGLAVLKGGLGLGTRYDVLSEDRAGRRPHDHCAGRAMVVLASGRLCDKH